MFGDGISILDLTRLLGAIRQKELVLQVKILDGDWREFSRAALVDMVNAILGAKVNDSGDIRARLHAKGAPKA
jgi:hypothetical protein